MSHRFRSLGIANPPADPTGQALAILGLSALPCLPIAAGVAGGFYVGKSKGAVAPIVGGLLGGLVSVLWIRSNVASGTASITKVT